MKQFKGITVGSNFTQLEHGVSVDDVSFEETGESCITISFPKDRISDNYFESKGKLKKINHPCVNPYKGYAISDDRCYILLKKFDGVRTLASLWENMLELIDEEEEYMEIACKFVYCVAHFINYLKEQDLDIGYFSINTISVTNSTNLLINGFCLPEIFGLDEVPDVTELYTKYCKAVIPKFFEDYESVDYLKILSGEIELPQGDIDVFLSYCEERDNTSESEDESNHEDGSEKKEISSVDKWKKSNHPLHYLSKLESKKLNPKKLCESNEYDYCENNFIILKGITSDFKTYENLFDKAWDFHTSEVPHPAVIFYDQFTDEALELPNKERIIFGYSDDYIPLVKIVASFKATELTIMAIRMVYSLMIYQSLYKKHGFLTKHSFLFKKGHKSKVPKIKVTGAGLCELMSETTDDFQQLSSILSEISSEFGNELLDKVKASTNFFELLKYLLATTSWMPENTDQEEVFWDTFGYICQARFPFNFPKEYLDYTGFSEIMMEFKQKRAMQMVLGDYKRRNPMNVIQVLRVYYNICTFTLHNEDEDAKLDKLEEQMKNLDPNTLNDEDLGFYGFLLVKGRYFNQDVEKGRKALEKSSVTSAFACYELSLITEDQKKAKKLLDKAVSLNYAPAITKSAGDDIVQIRRAAMMKDSEAIYKLACHYYKENQKQYAYGLMRMAANMNHPEAQCEYAIMLESSYLSNFPNIEAAGIYYRCSANQSSPRGIYHWGRYQEIYNNNEMLEVYKLAYDAGVKFAQIPLIACDKEYQTVEEVEEAAKDCDPIIKAQLYFTVASSYPELSEGLVAKASELMKEGDESKFFDGIGLNTIFNGLKFTVEKSFEYGGICCGKVWRDVHTKVLKLGQFFPCPAVDTINILVREKEMKVPRDKLEIRSAYVKLAKNEEYMKDQFFLFNYTRHIEENHLSHDASLEPFVKKMKERIKASDYWVLTHMEIRYGKKNRDKYQRELTMKGNPVGLFYWNLYAGDSDNKSESIENKKIKPLLEKFPEIIINTKGKFVRMSKFIDGLKVTSLRRVLSDMSVYVNPQTVYEYLRPEAKYLSSTVICETKKFKVEQVVDIGNFIPKIKCTFFNPADKNKNLLNLREYEGKYPNILFPSDGKFDDKSMALFYPYQELKPLKDIKKVTPLEQSLLLANIIKCMYSMEIIRGEIGDISIDNFFESNGEITLLGINLVKILGQSTKDNMKNVKSIIEKLVPKVNKNFTKLFDQKISFISLYQLLILNPEQYVVDGTDPKEFINGIKDFNLNFAIDEAYPCDLLFMLMSEHGIVKLWYALENNRLQTDLPQQAMATILAKTVKCDLTQYMYEKYLDPLKERLREINPNDLNDITKEYYTYCKLHGYCMKQEDVKLSDSVIGNRLKVFDMIKQVEKEAFEDFDNQEFESMALKLKKLARIGAQNTINLYGMMHEYGISCHPNPELANQIYRSNKVKKYHKFGAAHSLKRQCLGYYDACEGSSYGQTLKMELEMDREDIHNSYKGLHSISAKIGELRSVSRVTDKVISQLLEIEKMPYKIEALFTAGYLLETSDPARSKELRQEAMDLYLQSKYAKISDCLVFLNGHGLSWPIVYVFDQFYEQVISKVNVLNRLKNGFTTYDNFIYPWYLKYGEDFEIPEAVTLMLIKKEKDGYPVARLYKEFEFWSNKSTFSKNVFFLFHYAIFLRSHGFDESESIKTFIAHAFKQACDLGIDRAAGLYYYMCHDEEYGVALDKDEAITYLKRSMDSGCNEATYAYAVNLFQGKYVIENKPAAKMYLTAIEHEYQPAKVFLESSINRNLFDFKAVNDEEISSGSVEKIEEEIDRKDPLSCIGFIVAVAQFCQNFKDFFPLIMSIFRIIQSCSSSFTPNNQPEEAKIPENIKKIFDWSTNLLEIISNDWLGLNNITKTETSVLMSLLFTFFFSFMIFSFNTNWIYSLKSIVASGVFIPLCFGIYSVEKSYGIALLVIGLIMILVSGVLGFLLFIKTEIIQTMYQKLYGMNIFIKVIVGIVLIPFTAILFLGEQINNIINNSYEYEEKTDKELKIDTYIILVLALIIVDLFTLSVLEATTIYIIFTVLIVIVLILIGILIAKLNLNMERLRVTFNELWMFFFVTIAELLVMPIIDNLSQDEDPITPTAKAITSILSVIYPLILMILFTIKLGHVWKVTHPTYFRIWIRTTVSFIAKFGESTKARFFFWTVIDFIYHIIFSLSSSFGGPISNIIFTFIYIVAILLLRPFMMLSDNVLTIGEPFLVFLLNILLLAMDGGRDATLALGIVFLILSFAPAIASLVIFITKERDHEFDILKDDLMYEYDRVEQKEGMMIYNSRAEIVGYEDYAHLYSIWPGQLEEVDVPELDFKQKRLDSFGKNAFVPINACALMVGYFMMYLWIGSKYIS